MHFNSKIVLVTGGSSGLGLATAQAFAAKEAQVIIASRNEEKLQKNWPDFKNEGITFIPTDFSSIAQVHQLFEQIKDTFGKLDIAINNAASSQLKAITDCEETDFDYNIQVNLKSVWLSMKHELLLMAPDTENAKHIINVSSVNGLGGAEYASLYAACKAGVISLAKSAALEYANSHIAINALVPGAFDTPMLQEAMAMHSQGDPEKLEAVKKQYYSFIPRGRFGKAEEFAQTVLWLCWDKAPYLTGSSIILDGGMTSRFR